MEFILKAQSLGGSTQTATNSISLTHEFDTTGEKLLRKRGRLYIVINMSASKKFDLKAATQVFIDRVQEDYFRMNDDSPLHAVEKALSRGYKTLMDAKSKDETISLGSQDASLHFSFATALIWNSVLYTSYSGNPAVYLIRGSGTRDLGHSQGDQEIWTNSSILADNDVIIIGTETFADAFKPTEITSNLGNLSNVIATHEKKDSMAAILIKAMSSDHNTSRSFMNRLAAFQVKDRFSQTVWKIKGRISETEALSDRFKLSQSKKTAPVSSINSMVTASSAGLDLGTKMKPRRLSKVSPGKKRRKTIVVGVLMLAGILFMNYSLFSNTNTHDDNEAASPITSGSNIKGAQDAESLHPIFVSMDTLAEKLDPIAVDTIKDGKLMVLSTGALHQVDLDSKEIAKIADSFENAKHMVCDDKLCYILMGNTLNVIDPKTPDKIDPYPLGIHNIVDIASYDGKVYLLTSSGIHRLTLLTDAPENWLNDGELLSNARSLAVDNSLYVLEDRDIKKYTNGALQDSFEINNTYLLEPSLIRLQDNRLYVLDPLDNSESKIVVYDKITGDFIEEILLTERTDLDTPTMFAITRDDKDNIIFYKGDSFFVVDKGDE